MLKKCILNNPHFRRVIRAVKIDDHLLLFLIPEKQKLIMKIIIIKGEVRSPVILENMMLPLLLAIDHGLIIKHWNQSVSRLFRIFHE